MSGVARLLFLKCFHQETVNSAELAVAEDADHVARFTCLQSHSTIEGTSANERRNLPTFLYLKDEFAHIQSFLGSQLLFSGNGADATPSAEPRARRVPAGIYCGGWYWSVVQKPPRCAETVTLAQGGKCLGNGGRVVAEIVNQGDTRFYPENLHPAVDALNERKAD
jgi:hypothetical protein